MTIFAAGPMGAARRRAALRRAAASLAVAAFLGASCTASGGGLDPLAGRYLVKGGGGAADVFAALTQGFAAAHPKIIWDFEDIGSKGGATAVASGEADLGTSSVDLKQLPPGIDQLPIGVIGSGLAVSVSNSVTGLTRDQVRDIYSGTITDWSAVGGTPGPISVVTRSTNSAIWSSFKAYFFDPSTKLAPVVAEVAETDEALRAARGSASAIVLVTANAQTRRDPTVRLLAIDGATPTADNLRNGSYKVRRPLFLLFKVDGSKPAVAAFLTFVRGPEGQRIISQFQ